MCAYIGMSSIVLFFWILEERELQRKPRRCLATVASVHLLLLLVLISIYTT